MKTLVLYNNPVAWISPFSELGFFEPVFTHANPVEENITRNPHGYGLSYSIPGFRKKDLKIKTHNNELIVEGHVKTGSKLFKKGQGNYSASFARKTVLTEDMDAENIKARFSNGKLIVEIPKKKEFINYREIPVTGTEDPEEIQKDVTNKKHGMLSGARHKIQKVFKRAA